MNLLIVAKALMVAALASAVALLAQTANPSQPHDREATLQQRISSAMQPMCDAAAPKLREAGTNTVALSLNLDAKGRVKALKTRSPKGLKLEKMPEAAAAVKQLQFGPPKNGQPNVAVVDIEFFCRNQPKAPNAPPPPHR